MNAIKARKKARSVKIYTGKEALEQIVIRLRKRLKMKEEEIRYRVEFNDDTDHHTSRRASMWYENSYRFSYGKRGSQTHWSISLGTPVGNGYFYDGMEADIILIKGRDFYNSTFFRYTILACQRGEILQAMGRRINLIPWAEKKFKEYQMPENQYEPLRNMREERLNPFQRFLPRDLVYDRKLINSLADQLELFMLDN